MSITLALSSAWTQALAQTAAEQMDMRQRKHDYESRKMRARKEEERADEKRGEALGEDDMHDLDRKPSQGKPEGNSPQDKSDNRSDGSQYSGETFQDSDFSKNNFTELLLDGAAKPGDKGFAPADQADLSGKSDRTDDQDKKGDDKGGVSVHSRERDDDRSDRNKDGKHRRSHFDELSELLKPPPPMGPNDWVPDKLDPITNGGFTTSPDSGSPVPYRLNGHVDLERDLPWLHDQ
jgi:hypothetical protein